MTDTQVNTKQENTERENTNIDIDLKDANADLENGVVDEMSPKNRAALIRKVDESLTVDKYRTVKIDGSSFDIEDDYRCRLFPNDITLLGSIKVLNGTPENGVTFYTDGSYAKDACDAAGGVGIIGITDEGNVWCAGRIMLRGIGAISSSDIETLGIIIAYRLAKDKGVKCNAIISDMEGAKNTIESMIPEINCVQWVRGHNGCAPNVVADALAKRALGDALDKTGKENGKVGRYGCKRRFKGNIPFLHGEYEAGGNKNNADALYVLCDMSKAGEAHYMIAHISRAKRKVVHVAVGHILCHYGRQLDVLAGILPQCRENMTLFLDKPLREIATTGETGTLNGSEISGASMRDFSVALQRLGYSDIKANDVFRQSVTANVVRSLRDSEVLLAMKSDMTPALLKADLGDMRPIPYNADLGDMRPIPYNAKGGATRTVTLNRAGNPFGH